MRVEQYGRLLYWVSSESRYGLRFLVDLEGQDNYPAICNCEAFRYHGHRPCKHILAAFLAFVEPLGLSRRESRKTLDIYAHECDWADALLFAVKLLQLRKEKVRSKVSASPTQEHEQPRSTKRQYLLK